MSSEGGDETARLMTPPTSSPPLCLVYIEEKKLDAMSKNELDVLIDESLAYDEVLRKSGHYLVSEALQPVETVTTVRIRNGKLSIADGPFAETKEQQGGFFLINARDLNDAIHAQKIADLVHRIDRLPDLTALAAILRALKVTAPRRGVPSSRRRRKGV